MLMYSSAKACFEHSNFLKVKRLPIRTRPIGHARRRQAGPALPAPKVGPPTGETIRMRHLRSAYRRPSAMAGSATTSFLTAATLIYATRAGITAAAGTRLALLLLLVNGFRLYSSQIPFQFGPGSGISRHYFGDVPLSNFRSCCLPWKWRQCIRPPLRDQTLIFRYPSISF